MITSHLGMHDLDKSVTITDHPLAGHDYRHSLCLTFKWRIGEEKKWWFQNVGFSFRTILLILIKIDAGPKFQPKTSCMLDFCKKSENKNYTPLLVLTFAQLGKCWGVSELRDMASRSQWPCSEMPWRLTCFVSFLALVDEALKNSIIVPDQTFNWKLITNALNEEKI